MTDILLPAVSPTMEKATLARWLVEPGAEIKRGDIIAELETDKASVEIAAEAGGILSEILVAAGTVDVAVGTVIARMGGTVVRSDTHALRAPSGPAIAQTPTIGHAMETRPSAPHAKATPVQDQPSELLEALASPLARRLARQLGIDVRQVKGTGQRGRITKGDLERVDARLRAQPSQAAAQTSADVVHPAPYGVPHEVIALSAMRKTIARRLGESKRSVPHFYMTVDVEMDALLALREQCNLRASTHGASLSKLSVNDFAIRAVALALKAVPAANVQYSGPSLLRF